ncbi:MAG: hypothetical protein J7501_06995 [Bdellovibrio sp.]|nr:hypothetical protein [Bdellovibrio sp.]
MNKNELFQNIVSYRKGASAVGIHRELQSQDIPSEIKELIAKKTKKSK